MKSRFLFLCLILALNCLIPFPIASGVTESSFKKSRFDRGWATTFGGRGGRILRVTNLKAGGTGSFAQAVKTKGSRIIVFEVAGVINLNQKIILINEPYLTIRQARKRIPVSILMNGIYRTSNSTSASFRFGT